MVGDDTGFGLGEGIAIANPGWGAATTANATPSSAAWWNGNFKRDIFIVTSFRFAASCAAHLCRMLVKRCLGRESARMKHFQRALLAALACLLVVAPLGAAPTDPYRQMLAFEGHRSLGDGALATWLGSADEEIAVRAALAIGRTKRAAGAELLLAHVADARPAVRAMAVFGLGLIGRPADAAAVVAALKDRNGAVQVAATDAIDRYETAGHLGAFERAAQRSLLALLREHHDPIVRAHAAEALEGFSAPGTMQHITIAALHRAVDDDTNTRVRRTAMWSLFRGFAKTAPLTYFTVAATDHDDVVRIEAVRALGSRAAASQAKFLAQIAKNDPSWRVQEQAGESLRLVEHLTMTDHWKAIPHPVHLPKIVSSALDRLVALPRRPDHAKPTAPTAEQAILSPRLDPRTAAEMDGPAAGMHPRVRIVTTQGNLYVMLFPEWAPLTVANFLNLVNEGYYDKNPWFRVVPDFVVQTGDPKGDGNGDAGYTIPAEENPMMQYSGVISMGLNYDKNAPERDSAGTQYYITLSPQLHLDRDFTVFGRVIAGADVLAHLTEADSVIRIERISDGSE